MSDLFEPFQLGPITLANRVVMAPLTRSRAEAGNVPAADGRVLHPARHHRPDHCRSHPGVGHRRGYPNTPGLHTAEQVAGWRKVTDAVHAQGGKIFVQLWHVGRMSHTAYQPDGQAPVAPSAIAAKAKTFVPGQGMVDCSTPRALETAEIAGVVNDFRTAARNAIDAGFDGVEIHGAHGYLIDAFLRDGSNQRTDQYGGSIENRARFLLEVMTAVTAEIGADRVGIRLSPVSPVNDSSESNPQPLFEYVVRELEKLHPVFLHVVEGHTGWPARQRPVRLRRPAQALQRRLDGQQRLLQCDGARGGHQRPRRPGVLWSPRPVQPGPGAPPEGERAAERAVCRHRLLRWQRPARLHRLPLPASVRQSGHRAARLWGALRCQEGWTTASQLLQ